MHGASNCVRANANTIVYETCRQGYQQAPVITNLCSPTCPANTTDIGISCQKNTYDRGAGQLKVCPAGEQRDAGLCYPGCSAKHAGVGPVCWSDCPASLPYNCSAACTKDNAACAMVVTDQVTSPFISAGSIALTVLSAGSATGAITGAKAAAAAGRVAAMTATKAAARAGAKTSITAAVKAALRSSTAVTLQIGGRQIAKELAIDAAVTAVLTPAVWGIMDAVQKKNLLEQVKADVETELAKMMDDEAVDAVVELVLTAMEEQNPASDFPWTALDPTGIADIVRSYNLPLCSAVD